MMSHTRPSSATYEVVTDPTRLYALRDEWNDLCRRTAGHYLGQTFDWACLSWETTAAPRGRQLLCLLGRRGGWVDLIWPFVVRHGRVLSIAHPLGSESSEYTNVLIEDSGNIEGRIAAAWKALGGACGCDLVELPNVRSGSALGRMLEGAAAPKLVHRMDAPWICWEGIADWDTYHRSLGSARRRDLNRSWRRLAEAGAPGFEAVTDPARAASIIDWMLSHKGRWLEASGLRNDWILSPEHRAFLGASMAAFGPSGRRIVFVLSLDGRVITAELASVDGVRVESFMGVYDPEYARFSPGQLLQERALQWAFDRRLDYDLRIGGEAYKRHWANRTAQVASYVCANSVLGAAYVRGRLAGASMKAELVRHVPERQREAIKATLRSLTSHRATPRGPVPVAAGSDSPTSLASSIRAAHACRNRERSSGTAATRD